MREMNKLFLEIANYANENWNKGKFTTEEVGEYADMLFVAFNQSNINGKQESEIRTLCENLKEDIDNGCKVAEKYLHAILEKLGAI